MSEIHVGKIEIRILQAYVPTRAKSNHLKKVQSGRPGQVDSGQVISLLAVFSDGQGIKQVVYRLNH